MVFEKLKAAVLEHLTHTRFISRKVGFSRRCRRGRLPVPAIGSRRLPQPAIIEGEGGVLVRLSATFLYLSDRGVERLLLLSSARNDVSLYVRAKTRRYRRAAM